MEGKSHNFLDSQSCAAKVILKIIEYKINQIDIIKETILNFFKYVSSEANYMQSNE